MEILAVPFRHEVLGSELTLPIGNSLSMVLVLGPTRAIFDSSASGSLRLCRRDEALDTGTKRNESCYYGQQQSFRGFGCSALGNGHQSNLKASLIA